MVTMGQISDVIASRLHDVVTNGIFGVDYTFALDRDKNRALRRKYVIDDKKMIQILLMLDGSNYDKSEPSSNEFHLGDTVHVFRIQVNLMQRYKEDAMLEQVWLYIKITWPEGEEPLFIISFHEDE